MFTQNDVNFISTHIMRSKQMNTLEWLLWEKEKTWRKILQYNEQMNE